MTGLVCTALTLYLFILLIRIILSWIPISGDSPLAGVVSFFYALTEPVLAPLRNVIPPVRLGAMALDLSPIIVFIGIRILMGVIC